MVTAEILTAQFSRLARRVVAGDMRAAVAMSRLETALDTYISGVR
jgi:hypothetical protein